MADPFADFKPEEIEPELIECIQILSYPGTQAKRWREVHAILLQMESEYHLAYSKYHFDFFHQRVQAQKPKRYSTFFFQTRAIVRSPRYNSDLWPKLVGQLKKIEDILHERGTPPDIDYYREAAKRANPTVVIKPIDPDVDRLAGGLDPEDLPKPKPQ